MNALKRGFFGAVLMLGILSLGASFSWADSTWEQVLNHAIDKATTSNSLDIVFNSVVQGQNLLTCDVATQKKCAPINLTENEKADLITRLYTKLIQLKPQMSQDEFKQLVDNWQSETKRVDKGFFDCFLALRTFSNSQFVSQATDCDNLGKADLSGDTLKVCKEIAPIIAQDVEKNSGSLTARFKRNTEDAQMGTVYAINQSETGQSGTGSVNCTSVADQFASKPLNEFFKYMGNPSGSGAGAEGAH